MRSIQELIVMRRKLEQEFSRIESDTNKSMTLNWGKRQDALQRMVFILDDAINFYPLFEFLNGEERVEEEKLINHIVPENVQ